MTAGGPRGGLCGLVGLVGAGLLLSLLVAAVVGAVTYAGLFEDQGVPDHECECCS